MSDDETRRYRKKERARQERETRRRITEAAVELHRTLGPARAGVTDVAERAGVSRTTVYTHFPTQADLFLACSSHWASRNPLPDPSVWADVEDPSERLTTGLTELYRWYHSNEEMLGKVLRDVPVVPALASVMGDLWSPFMERVIDALAPGGPGDRPRDPARTAALELVVDFHSWRVLTGSGLDDVQAAGLAAGMVVSGASEPVRDAAR